MLKISGHLELYKLHLIYTKKFRYQLPVKIYRPLKIFFGLWFPDKCSESTKAKELNQMNLNTREIVVVHIGFRFLIIFDFASEDRGRKSIFEKCSVLGYLFLDIIHCSEIFC